MASKDEEFETDNGIEAGDLASLLCRFEEATSTVIDLRLCMQNKNTRNTLIKARNSTGTPDSSTFTVQTMSCSLENERNTAKALHSSTSISSRNGTYSNSGFIEPPLCQTEPIDKATTASFFSTEIQLVHNRTEQSEPTVLESWNSISAKIFEDSGSPAVLWPQETNSSKHMLLMKELVLQDAVSKCSTLINVDRRNSKPNVSLASSIESSYEALTSSEIHTECPVLSTVGAFEVNSIPSSSHGLMQLQSHQNPVLSSTSSMYGDNFGILVPKNVDLINCLFSHDIEHGSDIENCILKESTAQHAIFNFENTVTSEFDHSYCSNNWIAASDMHRSKFLEESLRSSNFTTSKNFLQQTQVTALDIGEPSYSITDVLCDYSVVTNSKNTDELILEDKEIFVDSNGNDLYSQDACQSFNTRKCEYNQEAMTKTPEKKENRKRHYSCLQPQKYNAGSVYEERNIFYDKIPSYYTALSIPFKPVTTTVFASTTKAIGTTDHLDLLDASGPFDEGHYDKVPAHRRCFTNTTKDVDIKCENSDVHDSASNIIPVQNCFKNSAHEINSSSFQAVLPCVENDEKHASNLQSHYSKIQGQRSRSTTRRSSSTSRFSRRSASSMSDCSTCSSCSNSSGCSTCSIFSRSSSSSGNERGSSRSRSPSSSRGCKYSAKRIHHLTPSKVSRSRSRTVSPSEDSSWRSKQHSYRNRHNSSMEVKSEKRKIKEEEQAKAMEERRIVYVGKIPDGYTKKQLYQRFQSFGDIREVKVNFREHGDNYGFVTFTNACDAIAAKEKGNSIPGEVKFDLCFGGRRHFCPDQYSDLDGNREIEEEYAPMSRNVTEDLDYTALLKLHSTHQRKKIA